VCVNFVIKKQKYKERVMMVVTIRRVVRFEEMEGFEVK